MSSFSPWPAFEKKVHKIHEWFGYRYGLAWAKWTSTIVVFHKRERQSLMVLPFSCYWITQWNSLSPPMTGRLAFILSQNSSPTIAGWCLSCAGAPICTVSQVSDVVCHKHNVVIMYPVFTRIFLADSSFSSARRFWSITHNTLLESVGNPSCLHLCRRL